MPQSQTSKRHLDADTRERERGEQPAFSSSHVQTESDRKTRTKTKDDINNIYNVLY